MFITISGMLGSGKSTVCGVLKNEYGFEVFSTGAILRGMAKEKGMSALEFNGYITDNENEADAYIDKKVVEIAERSRGKNIVFDSRLAWHFVPDAFKVFLTVSSETAARRVFEGRREEVEKYSSEEEALRHLAGRKELEDRRFFNVYGLDCNNKKNYDLVLSTESISAEEAAYSIIKHAEKRLVGVYQ